MEAKSFVDDFTNRVIQYLEEKEKKHRRGTVKSIETDEGFYCGGCDTHNREDLYQCEECRVWNCAYCTTWCDNCDATMCCDDSLYDENTDSQYCQKCKSCNH